MSDSWQHIANAGDIASPALLVYPKRIEENIRRMISMVSNAKWLRPHVKTHKMAEIIQLQIDQGIYKFKTASIAEAEMVAEAGAKDILIAYQLVGPNVGRLIALSERYPEARFATIVDNLPSARELSAVFEPRGQPHEVYLDIDCGMHRTGIEPGEPARIVYSEINRLPGLRAAGFHVYDGHLHDRDLNIRTVKCNEAFDQVMEFKHQLEEDGLSVPIIVAGGTPTFPIHAARGDVECSPGTCILSDSGYSQECPDLDFLHAATLLTRVISKPGTNRVCVDLGHKAVAADKPQPRALFQQLPDADLVSQSEEHLVIETHRANELEIGQILYGIPRHICPTVALHAEAIVVRNGQAVDRWRVVARARRISI